MALDDLVTPAPVLSPEDKLRIALELHDAGVQLVRERIARENPDLSDAEVHERVVAWLHSRPMPGVGSWGRLRDPETLK